MLDSLYQNDGALLQPRFPAWHQASIVNQLCQDKAGIESIVHCARVGDRWWIHLDGAIHMISIDEQGAGGGGEADGMVAPMPGKVLEILCQQGDTVEEGQTLIVMEAMKMEHRIAATESGTVAVIHHAVGEQVDAGSTLIDIESDE